MPSHFDRKTSNGLVMECTLCRARSQESVVDVLRQNDIRSPDRVGSQIANDRCPLEHKFIDGRTTLALHEQYVRYWKTL